MTGYLISILIMAAVTIFLRAIPFLLFGGRRTPPAFITHLSSLLPYAVMMMLVVYCLRNLSFTSAAGFVPELICIGLVILLHLWKHNIILSIVTGTVAYMVLVQTVFA